MPSAMQKKLVFLNHCLVNNHETIMCWDFTMSNTLGQSKRLFRFTPYLKHGFFETGRGHYEL